MRVVVADDEPLARALLRTLLFDAGIDVVAEASTGTQAKALVTRFRPDAIFLDIDMPGADGISAAHQLQGASDTQVVFVTAHDQHALDAFDLGAVDYVLKPVRRARLARAVERIRARMPKAGAPDNGATDQMAACPAFWIATRRGRVRLPVSDIVRIEAARDHVYLHTEGPAYLYRTTMAELEEKLRGSGLVRIGRSAFIRTDKVIRVLRRGRSMVLELVGATEVPVGPTYQMQTLHALAEIEAERPH